MQQFFRSFRGWFQRALQSLAFLPLPMMMGGILLGIFLFYLETETDLSLRIIKVLPSEILSSQETARSLLGLIIGGMITLTVFTFTQMMTVFSQVASSYSPRLLSIFTGSRKLQLVMGTYLATIVLNIIVLLSIRSNEEGYVPNFSVLICIVLGVVCLLMFIYFVTEISQRIQVTTIIKDVFDRGERSLRVAENRAGFSEQAMPDDLDEWYVIPSPVGGFVGTVDFEYLSQLARKFQTRFYLGTARGQFVPRHQPLVQSEQKLNVEQIEEVLNAVSPVASKYDNWYLPPVRLLTEIAVKAMSPGINDPGTAVDAIDRLTGLLLRLMHLPNFNHYQDPDDKGDGVWLKSVSFTEVLTLCLQELRCYCKADPVVVRRLCLMMFHLLAATKENLTLRMAVQDELEALLDDARANLTNARDRKLLAKDLHFHRAKLRQLFNDADFLLDAHLDDDGVSPSK